MQTLKNKLHLAAARLSPGRAVVVAMLLGPLVGALLAYGAVAAQEPTEVTIDNFTFGPPELTVAAGTTVKFVNHDDIPHNVVDKNKAFRSKPRHRRLVLLHVRECRLLRLFLRPASANDRENNRQVTAAPDRGASDMTILPVHRADFRCTELVSAWSG